MKETFIGIEQALKQRKVKHKYKQKRFHKLKAKGICTSCAKRKPIKGILVCPICRESKVKSSIRYKNKLK